MSSFLVAVRQQDAHVTCGVEGQVWYRGW